MLPFLLCTMPTQLPAWRDACDGSSKPSLYSSHEHTQNQCAEIPNPVMLPAGEHQSHLASTKASKSVISCS